MYHKCKINQDQGIKNRKKNYPGKAKVMDSLWLFAMLHLKKA